MIDLKCGEEAKKSMVDFLDGSFGGEYLYPNLNISMRLNGDSLFAGLTDMLFSKKEFNPSSKLCTSKFAPLGAKTDAKLSDNLITKYTASYFGFLFN